MDGRTRAVANRVGGATTAGLAAAADLLTVAARFAGAGWGLIDGLGAGAIGLAASGAGVATGRGVGLTVGAGHAG